MNNKLGFVGFILFSIHLLSSTLFCIELIGSVSIEPDPAKRIVIQDSFAYLFHQPELYLSDYSLSIFDVSDPYSPTFMVAFDSIGGRGSGYGNHVFEVKDSFIFVPNGDNLLIYRLVNLDSLCLVSTIDYPSGGYLVEVQDSLLFLCQMYGDLLIFDISDIAIPELLTTVSSGIAVRNFNVFDSLIVLTSGFDIVFYLMVTPDHVIRLPRVDITGPDWYSGDICYRNGFVYWATLTGVIVIDVRDTSHYEYYSSYSYCVLFMDIYDSILIVNSDRCYPYFCLIENDTIIHAPFDSIVVEEYYNHGDFDIELHYLYAMDHEHLNIYDLSTLFSGISETEPINNYELLQAYPNPFNSSCRINAPPGSQIQIYDLTGRGVFTMECTIRDGANGASEAMGENSGNAVTGLHANGEFLWRPNPTLSSGIYFVKATLGEQTVTKRVVYLK
ncbi:hypothetical protein JXI42_07345 [bacterium]|nr:hypothetical protein [bacterium]